jgi:hypothetical protein
MDTQIRSGHISRLACAFLLATTATYSQTPAPANDTPVGQWVAEHPSQGGIGSWWDFRSDGTFTMHIGVIVTSQITRSGDTFTSPPVTTNGPPITVTFHVEGDTLHLKSSPTPEQTLHVDGETIHTKPSPTTEQTLTRIGPAPSATDPLLGKWKPVPPATPSPDPNIAAQEKMMTNATLVFLPNNTENLRVSLTSSEGTWSASTHTFQVEHQPLSFSYQRAGDKLTLGQPPDNKKTDTYIPDPNL